MSAIAIERFEPVRFSIANIHLGEAAELLREPLKQSELVHSVRKRLEKLFDRVLFLSGKGDYLNEKFRNEVLGATAFAAAGTVYLGLWTTTAGTNLKTYVGNTAGEVASSGSYDRVAKTNNTTNFAAITGAAAKVNSNAMVFATATGNWNSSATIPQFIVFDGNAKSAADNNLLWGDWTTAKAVLSGDTAQVNTSAFSWTET